MMYQLGWATLPGLRGMSVSGFRATPTDAPDNERGVAIELGSEDERDHRACAARCARRLEARAPPDSFRHVRAGADVDEAVPQMREDRGRSPRQISPARRHACL